MRGFLGVYSSRWYWDWGSTTAERLLRIRKEKIWERHNCHYGIKRYMAAWDFFKERWGFFWEVHSCHMVLERKRILMEGITTWKLKKKLWKLCEEEDFKENHMQKSGNTREMENFGGTLMEIGCKKNLWSIWRIRWLQWESCC